MQNNSFRSWRKNFSNLMRCDESILHHSYELLKSEKFQRTLSLSSRNSAFSSISHHLRHFGGLRGGYVIVTSINIWHIHLIESDIFPHNVWNKMTSTSFDRFNSSDTGKFCECQRISRLILPLNVWTTPVYLSDWFKSALHKDFHTRNFSDYFHSFVL